MSDLPEGPEAWQYYHQNLARLWLNQARSITDRMLAELKRIQGEDQEQIMRQFLRHEQAALKAGTPLVKPQSVVDAEASYTDGVKSSAERHEQTLADNQADSASQQKLYGDVA